MSSDQDSKIAEIRDRIARAKEEKRVRANEQLHTQEEPHRTLYDVLQENQQRLDDEYSKRYTERNALKRLDEDEISYLEALKEKERQHEQRIQAEVEDGLEEYRKQRERLAENVVVPRTELSTSEFKVVKKRPAAKRVFENVKRAESNSEKATERRPEITVDRTSPPDLQLQIVQQENEVKEKQNQGYMPPSSTPPTPAGLVVDYSDSD